MLWIATELGVWYRGQNSLDPVTSHQLPEVVTIIMGNGASIEVRAVLGKAAGFLLHRSLRKS